MNAMLTVLRSSNGLGLPGNVIMISASEEGSGLPKFWPVWARKIIQTNFRSSPMPTVITFHDELRVYTIYADRLLEELPQLLEAIQPVEQFIERVDDVAGSSVRCWRLLPWCLVRRQKLERLLSGIQPELGGSTLKLRVDDEGQYIVLETPPDAAVAESTVLRQMALVEWLLYVPLSTASRA